MTDATGKGQGLAIDNLTFSASSPQAVEKVALSIRLSGANAVIAWPAAASNGVLQVNSSLVQAGSWSTVTQPWQIVGGSNTVTLPIGTGPQFFRLRP